MKTINPWLLAGVSLLALLALLNLDVLGIDSGQYAWISLEMLQTGNYLEVYQFGKDYLDKPPLLFWISSLAFDWFGVHNWSYRIFPVLIAFGLGAGSAYGFARDRYNREVAKNAALLVLFSVAWWLFTFDLRTDAMVGGFLMFSIWQLDRYIRTRSTWAFLLAFAAIGISMLAKGPLGLVFPALAIGPSLVIEGKWRQLFKWQWLLGILVVFAILAPMMWGLYQQFDLHPEKVLRFHNDTGYQDKEGVSGLRFYWWTQSFGRITGENVWKNDSGSDFFVHTALWAYLPFALLGFGAVFNRLLGFFKKSRVESITFFGFLLPFIALSTSAYKLPHYIFPLYPLLAVLTAAYIQQKGWGYKLFLILHGIGLAAIIGLGVFLLLSFQAAWWKWALAALALIMALLNLIKWKNLVIGSSWVATFGFIGLFFQLYPNLLQYQSGSMLAQAAINNNLNPKEGGMFNEHSFHLAFYMKYPIPATNLNLLDHDDQHITWLYTNKEGLGLLMKAHPGLEIVAMHKGLNVTNLSPDFFDREKREASLKGTYLVKLPR